MQLPRFERFQRFNLTKADKSNTTAIITNANSDKKRKEFNQTELRDFGRDSTCEFQRKT